MFEDHKDDLRALAAICKEALQRLNKSLDSPPYNYFIHNSPFISQVHEFYHWHIEIMPRITRTAGFERGSGFYINPTPPEDAAQYLRSIEL
jgi:UDPglucose--hexose-1-phosphate uridylyltransferase